MKTLVLNVCTYLFFMLSYHGFGQSDSLLTKIISQYYSNRDSSQIAEFEQRVNLCYYFNKERSVKNLIQTFGADYYTKSVTELRKEINNHILLDKLDSTHSYSYWENRIEWLRDTLGTGEIIYPENQIWDDFLTFDFPKDPFGGSWKYKKGADSVYNYVADFQAKYDSTLKISRVINADSIRYQIEEVKNYRKRWNIYFLFLMNLFVSEKDYDLGRQSYNFVYNILDETNDLYRQSQENKDDFTSDTIIEDNGKINIRLTEDELVRKFGSVAVLPDGQITEGSVSRKNWGDTIFSMKLTPLQISHGLTQSISKNDFHQRRFGIESHLDGDYLLDPYSDYISNNQIFEHLDDKEKLYWIIGCIKFLATRNCHYFGNISEYFGLAYAILSDNKELQEEYLFIRLLEVQFYDELSQKFVLDRRFAYEGLNILREDFDKQNDSSDLVFFQQNYLLAKLALNIWTKSTILRYDYGDRYKLQVAQWIFNASQALDYMEGDDLQKVRWRVHYLELLCDYYIKEFEFSKAKNSVYLILEELYKYPQFFTKNDLDNYIFLLCLVQKIGGFNYEYDHWIGQVNEDDALISMKFMPEVGESKISGVQKANLISKIGLNVILAFDASDEEFNDARLSEIVKLSMVSFEVDRAQKKRYRKAYKIHQYLERHGDPRDNENYLRQTNLRDKTELRALRKILDQERRSLKLREEILDSLGSLYGQEILLSHTNIVNLNYNLENQEKESNRLSHIIDQKENQLVGLQDSIAIEQFKLNQMIDTNAFYQALNNALKQDNADLEDDNIELQGTVEQQHQILVNRNWIIAGVAVFALLILIAFLIARKNYREAKRQKGIAEAQRNIAQRQKRISDSLRFAGTQMGHVVRNSIDRFKVEYISKFPEFSDPKEEEFKNQLIIAIDDIRRFLHKLNRKNKNDVIVHSLQQDVALAISWATVEFGAKTSNAGLESYISYSDEHVKTIPVPIYTVANIIHNSFKYTELEGLEIKITAQEGKEYVKVSIKDCGNKIEANSTGVNGTDYINKALHAHNGEHFDSAFVSVMGDDKKSFETTFKLKKDDL